MDMTNVLSLANADRKTIALGTHPTERRQDTGLNAT